MTEAERELWFHLRRRQLGGFPFRRQHPLGLFVVDFVCPEPRLAVEVDGSQHLDAPADQARDAWLRGRGFQVFRCWNHEVLWRTEQVLEALLLVLREPSGHLPPWDGERLDGAAARRNLRPLAGKATNDSPSRGRGAEWRPLP